MKFHPCLSFQDEISSRQKRVNRRRHFNTDRDDFIPGWNFTCKHPLRWIGRSSHPEVFLRKSVLKIYSKSTGEHPCRSVISIKFLKQLYWNHTSAWVFSCKFAAYFQNTFYYEHLWTSASVYLKYSYTISFKSWLLSNTGCMAS